MNIGDMFRKVAGKIDGLVLRGMGRPIYFVGTELIPLRANYELPSESPCKFGIDHSDEVDFEFDYEHLVKKIGRLPKFDEKFMDFKGNTWQVISRRLKDNFYLGESRLIIVMQRYQENLTSPEK